MERPRILRSLFLVLVGFLLGLGLWATVGRGTRRGAETAAVAPLRTPGSRETPTAVASPSSGRTELAAPVHRVRTAEPVPASTDLAATGPEEAAMDRMPGPEGRREMMERLLRLQRGGSDADRLAAAREILAEGPGGIGSVRALAVLAELDPGAVSTELRRWVEEGMEGREGRHLLATAIRTQGQDPDVLSSADLDYLYRNGSREVQLAAATALEARGDRTLVRLFVTSRAADLASEDADVRAAAVRDLGSTRSPETLSLLVPLLSDPSEQVRLQALMGVREAGGPEALVHVRQLVDDPSRRVSSTARRMVEMLERRAAWDQQRGDFRPDLDDLGRQLDEDGGR